LPRFVFYSLTSTANPTDLTRMQPRLQATESCEKFHELKRNTSHAPFHLSCLPLSRTVTRHSHRTRDAMRTSAGGGYQLLRIL